MIKQAPARGRRVCSSRRLSFRPNAASAVSASKGSSMSANLTPFGLPVVPEECRACPGPPTGPAIGVAVIAARAAMKSA